MSATKIKIVVADDESIIIKGICKILSGLDDISEVCGTASNGAQLLKLVQEKKPDLVITDVCMPELSGLDVISRIQDIKPQPMTVIISGYRDFEYAQSAMKCGVKEYLLKPVDPEAIISLVRRRHKDILKEKSINVLENQVYDADVSNDQAAYYQVVVAKCCDAEREAALEKFCDETMLPQCYTLKYHKDLCIIFSFSCIEDFGGKAFDYANFILENFDERTELNHTPLLQGCLN